MLHPKCRTGLSDSVSPVGITRHKFPTDETMHVKWMRAILREDWTHSKNTVICSLHSQSSDLVSRRTDNNISRGLQRWDLVKKILKADAVPIVFSLLPSYFTKKKPPERSQMTGKQYSARGGLQRANDQVMKVGHIKTLDELQLKMKSEIVPEGIYKILYQERLVFAYFSLDKQVGLDRLETTAVFGCITSGNFRQDYRYMRTSQHARLRKSTDGECS